MSASSIRRAESVLKITVQRDGTGNFTTISEAVLAVPYECEAEIEIGPGIYREKLVCEKRCITLRGAGADKTKLVWGDGGRAASHSTKPFPETISGEVHTSPGASESASASLVEAIRTRHLPCTKSSSPA